MLLIVGIQKIPSELYEAAEIDGAGAIDGFFHVTIPNIKEMILVDCITVSYTHLDVYKRQLKKR